MILNRLASFARRILSWLVFFLPCVFIAFFTASCAGCADEAPAPWSVHPEPDNGSVSFPSDLPPDITLSAGTISGAFSVSATGEAIYRLPLGVPPGRAGMQPSLALTYDSAMGDGGPVGKGFSISGLSAVTRCPHTAADNGVISGVIFAETDALCLDGKRLVKIKSVAEVDEYRTLPDTFCKVLAYYPAGWDRKRGPEHFEVHTKSGLTLTYGGSPDSQALADNSAVRTWWINRSTDRNQNSILYTYQNDKDPTGIYTTEIVPLAIRYTDHPTAPASRAVVFDYHKKPDSAARTLFTRGMALTNTNLLTAIRMLGPGDALVRAAYLSYESGGGTAQPLLSKVHECTTDKVCKPPTMFGWNIQASGFTQIATPIEVPASENAAVMPNDVDGDGRDDLTIPDAPRG
jgi:Salmonella virulence plasmid 65kDa B protein